MPWFRWIVVVGLLSTIAWTTWPPAQGTVVRCAESLLQERKPKEALVVLGPFLKAQSRDGEVCFLAAQANARLQQFSEAVRWFGLVPADHARRTDACWMAGEILLIQLHELSPAESFLLEALRLCPDHPKVQGNLAGLYGLCGLTTWTMDLRFRRLSTGQFAEVDLLLLALGDTAAENSVALEEYLRVNADDPLTQIARGHQAWQQHDFVTARACYERGLARRPDLDDAQARLGRILFEQADDAAFLKWHAALSQSAQDNPEIWVVRGDWSLRADDVAGSVRCYTEAVHRDPSHRRAHHQLGESLLRLGEARLAEPFQRRNADLQELLLAGKKSYVDPGSRSVQRAIAAANACGHSWEAWGWTEVARRRFPMLDSSGLMVTRPEAGVPRCHSPVTMSLTDALDRFPLPRWMKSSAIATRTLTEAVHSPDSAIRFTDDSARTGLHFHYVSGDDLPGPGMRMFQFSGGGVGALDYDRDGWPDLYFTQGGRWPVAEENPPADELFRNRLGAAFENVTQAAGIHETDYSQGLAVADFDSDGWFDLFVANVAGNRLFHNNGDGTFQEITESAGVHDTAWTTSAVGADFNGDGLPDLFVVNYVAGAGLLDRICHRADGTPRACTPHEFEAAEDQLLLNLGDGHFQDVTDESGILARGGKGLGVVAADFEQSGRLSLFVANDTTGNFFFQNRANRGATPKFEQTAILTGLAFDSEGRSQACMGVAADDADGDGRIDLFVTNYYNESNTLYLQPSGHVFVDSTSSAGLREPSLKQLGFGTQFMDADLDGWLDLVVTNGHVDDETALGIPYRMPTQVFRNQGKGRFVEVAAEQLGPWFQGKYLGRGLARLDWNRDGRDDFVVSIIDNPAALLTNDSQRQGRSVAFQLVGIESPRNPIGATIRINTGGRTLIKQLTAGDGYQANNESRLVIGVGDFEQVEVVISWPSGRTDSFRDVNTDACWIAIEGKRQLIRLNQ